MIADGDLQILPSGRCRIVTTIAALAPGALMPKIADKFGTIMEGNISFEVRSPAKIDKSIWKLY